MPGEISRSNPGPRGKTPYVPPWICKEKPGEAMEFYPDYCRFCLMPLRDHAEEKKP